MFHRIIFLLLIVSSLSCNLPLMFSVVHEHRLQEYSKRRAYQTLLSLHIVIKPLNNKINTINFLLFWSVTLLMFIQTLHSLQLAGRYIGDFGNFFSGFAKSPRVLRSSWIPVLNECNVYFKIVKYCILPEVCMIKTAPHSHLRLSDVIYKKYKRLVYTPPDLLARFCKANLSNGKNSAGFAFQVFVFQA